VPSLCSLETGLPPDKARRWMPPAPAPAHTTHTRPQVRRLCVSVAAASSVHNAGAASATEAVAVGPHDARACSPLAKLVSNPRGPWRHDPRLTPNSATTTTTTAINYSRLLTAYRLSTVSALDHRRPLLMALVSGPGRAGGGTGDMSPEMRLFVDKHVAYIQSLDTVRSMRWPCLLLLR
jgi:hypothetical protein